MSVGLFTILLLIQCLERPAERCGKVTEFLNLRTSKEVNGSLCTDPSLGLWSNVLSQSFLQCSFTQKSLGEVISQSFDCFTSSTPENGEGTFLDPKHSLLPAVHNCEWGGKKEEILFLVDLAPAWCLDLSSCSGKQIES